MHSFTPFIHLDSISIHKNEIIFPTGNGLCTTLVQKYYTPFFWWYAENYRMDFTCFYEYKIPAKRNADKGFCLAEVVQKELFGNNIF